MTIKGRILVVEDNPVTRLAMEEALVKGGYRVISAPDALTALDALRGRQCPRLLVLDLVLPGMSGITLLGAKEVDSIPLVVVTAMAEPAENLYRMGIPKRATILRKPTEMSQLVQVVNSVLGGPAE